MFLASRLSLRRFLFQERQRFDSHRRLLARRALASPVNVLSGDCLLVSRLWAWSFFGFQYGNAAALCEYQACHAHKQNREAAQRTGIIPCRYILHDSRKATYKRQHKENA
jgi:hypothetical protein